MLYILVVYNILSYYKNVNMIVYDIIAYYDIILYHIISYHIISHAYERSILHPVSVRRFPSFRTQPLENLSIDSVTNGFLSNPAPGENILSGNLVMETGYFTPNLPINITPY